MTDSLTAAQQEIERLEEREAKLREKKRKAYYRAETAEADRNKLGKALVAKLETIKSLTKWNDGPSSAPGPAIEGVADEALALIKEGD